MRLRYQDTSNGAACNATVRTACQPFEVFLYNTPLTQQTKMRNFAGFIQDRALSCELAAAFCLSQGLEAAGRAHLRDGV